MKKYTIAIVFLVISLSCYSDAHKSGKQFDSIEINSMNYELRKTSKDEVIKILGKPDRMSHFEKGGEDYFWEDFDAIEYLEKGLKFTFNNDGILIRVSIEISKNNISFLSISFDSRLKFPEFINLLDSKAIKYNVYNGTYLLFTIPSTNPNLITSLSFSNSGSSTWFDSYYSKTWK